MELNSWGEAPIFQCVCAYVEFLIANGYIEETWTLFKKINKIDPAFFMVFEYKSLLYQLNGETDKALEIVKNRSSYSSQEDWMNYASYGSAYYMAEVYDTATFYFEKALALDLDRDVKLLAWLSLSYYKTGKKQESQLILDELLLRNINNEIRLNTPIALIYNVMGNDSLALEWLEKAFEAREPYLLWVKIMFFKNLHDHPRYQELMRKIGFETT
jgi:tetratricopeptide (TPR) repeat protein